MLLFFLLSLARPGGQDLPFSDQSPEPAEAESWDEPPPAQSDSGAKDSPPLPPIKYKPLSSLIGVTEFVALALINIFVFVYIRGRKQVNAIMLQTKEKVLKSFDNYYAFLPARLTKYNMHRFDGFMTGRTTHKGCLLTVNLTKRCDIIGMLYDKLLKRKSTMGFEFILEPEQKIPMVFNISKSLPKHLQTFYLKQYDLDGTDLHCFYDLDDAKDLFMPEIEEFIRKYPGILNFLEISDFNRFNLLKESRYVVKIEFVIDGYEDVIFSDEIVNFCVSLADKFGTMHISESSLKAVQEKRKEFLINAHKKLEERGYDTSKFKKIE